MSAKKISLLEFKHSLIEPDNRDSLDMAVFNKAMEYCRQNPGTELYIPPGEYIISSELSKKTQQQVMEGSYGENPQHIMFNPDFKYTRGISFEGQKGTIITAYGVTLLIDGFMEPISIHNCSDITVCGITIDHIRKPYSKGKVILAARREVGDYILHIQLDESCPIEEKTPLNLRYVLYSHKSSKYFIPSQKEVQVIDRYNFNIIVEDTCIKETGESYEGLEYYTLHSLHSRPAILIEYAENIKLTDITIHSQPGMGIVGNRSENIFINRLSVVPSCGDHFSTNTDATHFTSLKGLLRLENCNFEGQGDDFINVHNYYHTITLCDEADTCYIRTEAVEGTHSQSLDYPDEGDILELTFRDSMELLDIYKVIRCIPLPEEGRALITLDHALPGKMEIDRFFLSNITRLPRLEVINCHAKNHFARGILVKTRNVLLENNTVTDIFGPAFYIASEQWWSEGVTAANVTIRRNRVINTRRPWGEAGGIVVKTDCINPLGHPIKNVIIEDNIIECPAADHCIYVRNTDGLVLNRNKMISNGENCVIEKCINIK